MDTFNNDKPNLTNKLKKEYSSLEDKADETYQKTKHKVESVTEQVKDTVSDLYNDGKQKFNNLEECIEEYSDELVQKIKEAPLTALLIAGGVGFILSKLLSK